MPNKLVLNLFRNHNQNKLSQPIKTNSENLSFIILVFHGGMSTIKVYFDYFVSGRVKWVPSSKLKCFDVFRPLVFLVPFSSSSIHQACNKETSGLGTTYLQKLYSQTTGKVLGRGHRSTKRKPPLFVR